MNDLWNEIWMKIVALVLSTVWWKDLLLIILGAAFGWLASAVKTAWTQRRAKKFWPTVGMIFFLMLSTVYLLVQERYVEVPDIIGTNYDFAAAQLTEAGLKYNAYYGKYGDVVTEIVDYQKYVKKDTAIEMKFGRIPAEGIDISEETDQEEVREKMPDLHHVSEEEAYLYLTMCGFTDIEVLTQYREDIVSGYVIKTEPLAGEELSLSDKIVLYVSINHIE